MYTRKPNPNTNISADDPELQPSSRSSLKLAVGVKALPWYSKRAREVDSPSSGSLERTRLCLDLKFLVEAVLACVSSSWQGLIFFPSLTKEVVWVFTI